MFATDRLSKYTALILSHLLVVIVAVFYTRESVREELLTSVNELREELGAVSQEVKINSSLRNGQEVKMGVIETLRELSDAAGSKLSTEQIVHIADVIMEKYRLHGIKPSLAISVIHTESSFDPRAVSSANAKGLMQVMDSTARPYLANYGIGWDREVLFDPVVNVKVALDYLRDLHEIHISEGLEGEDDYTVSLLRYNRSQPAMDKLLEDPLGLQYTSRINQIQSEIRKGGVI